MNIEALYAERSRQSVQFNDIWEHMGTLRAYASKVNTICEIGLRSGNSTTAFLAGLAGKDAAMVSYDIDKQHYFPPSIPGVYWRYEHANSHAPEFQIPICELLFIDGCHKYESVKADLRQAQQAMRFIIMHDTSPERDAEFGDGVCKALDEFLAEHSEWSILERFENNNGLTVLGRKIA